MAAAMMFICGDDELQSKEQEASRTSVMQMERSQSKAQDSEPLLVPMLSMAALASSCPEPFFLAFMFLNQSGAFPSLPSPGSQHLSNVCPVLEQFEHMAFAFFGLDPFSLAASAVSCLERVSHVHMS